MEPIVYIDKSAVKEGKVDAVKVAIRDLVDFIESNVPRAITYRVYLNSAGNQMTVLQIHPDSASLELHMTIGKPAFSKFKELIQLLTIDVYGQPTEALLQQLFAKAKMLGNASVTVHKLQAGFTRAG